MNIFIQTILFTSLALLIALLFFPLVIYLAITGKFNFREIVKFYKYVWDS